MSLCLEDRFNWPDSVWIAPSALVMGDVTIGKNSSVWFQTLLRADTDRIVIGENCNLQDACLLHNMEGYPVLIGDNVSLGHGVVAHGCTIEDHVLVGIRATLLDGVKVGHHSLIAAGSLVTERTVIPPYSLVMGAPAKVVSRVNEKHLKMIQETALHYVDYSRQYQVILPSWKPLDKQI